MKVVNRNTIEIRNYSKEAEDMVAGLEKMQCYELYEIVCNKLKRTQTDTRLKELRAVREAIETKSGLDKYRLKKLRFGYNSSMAQFANAKDGNTRPNKKKV